MSNELSTLSLTRLENVDENLVNLIKEVSKTFPINVLCGYRNEDDQNQAFSSGHSKEQWPNSKHNRFPSQAVDIVPQHFDPNEKDSIQNLSYLAGYVLGIAQSMNISIRWGGDWAQDWNTTKGWDFYHFELK